MNKLSIVIPVYYNEQNLRPLYEDLKNKLIDAADFEYEIVMVDDGSGDRSWEVICELAKQDAHIKAIHLSRNFGSHAASLCGLCHSTGDCVAVKAADLQEPTEMILEMYQKWMQGANVVLAVREDREDKSLFSELYYWLTRKLALSNMPEHGFDAFLLDRKVIHVLDELDEKNSALTGQILWSGFKTECIQYTRRKREIGKSRWTLKKKIRLASDTFFGFSTVPITMITWIGGLSCGGSAIWALNLLFTKLTRGIPVPGFTTLFIFQLFSFGVIMMTLGILGNYMWRTFYASRKRPVYIVEDMFTAERAEPANGEEGTHG